MQAHPWLDGVRVIPAWAGNTAWCKGMVRMAGRVIPAWAGNTGGRLHRRARPPGHPRVGGEHTLVDQRYFRTPGSSPRGRGTPCGPVARIRRQRVIPAWAGNTTTQRIATQQETGHPRVGGEHVTVGAAVERFCGSSPRGRGTRFVAAVRFFRHRVIPAWAGNTNSLTGWAIPGYGSSPRGRGTLSIFVSPTNIRRVIPAWAGNTAPDGLQCPANAGHPRVGGEHHGAPGVLLVGVGSSPRGRGTPWRSVLTAPSSRVIPAWAGNTPQASTARGCFSGHPRVGGEHSQSASQPSG